MNIALLILPFLALLISAIVFLLFDRKKILKEKMVIANFRDDFLKNMTHEFKTPITTIGMSAEMIRKKEILNTPCKVERYARIILGENQRLKKQVDSILYLSGSNELEMDLSPVNMHPLILNISKSQRMQVHKEGGSFKAYLEASDDEIQVDTVHMSNIIINLLENARKYADGSPKITLRTWNENKRFFLSVSDEGIGISEEFQDRIFEQFFRVPSGNIHNVKGFGIGLHYVKSMLEKQNGNIRLKSTEGAGSCFTIDLPN